MKDFTKLYEQWFGEEKPDFKKLGAAIFAIRFAKWVDKNSVGSSAKNFSVAAGRGKADAK